MTALRPLARRLVSESAIFGLGGAANQILNVILVPLFAAALGIAEFGVLSILNSTLALGSNLVGFALTQSFFRSFLRDAPEGPERLRVLRVALALRLVVSTIGVAIYLAVAPGLTLGLFGNLDRLPLVLLLAPNILLDTLNLIPLQFLRATRRPGLFAGIVFVRAVASGVGVLLLVIVFPMGVAGAVLGGIGGSLVAAVLGYAVIGRMGGLQVEFDRPLMRSMFLFSLPLVPAGAAGWTLNLSDRYVLQIFEGSHVVGIYSLGYSLGLALNVFVMQPFLLAWAAAKWDVARGEHAQATFASVMTALAVVACTGALGLAVLGTDAVRLLFPPGSEVARYIVPFSAFAYVFLGMHTMAMTGLHVAGQTRWVGVTMLVAAASNIGLNLVLIPLLGIMGAAIATILAYALLAVLTNAASQRYYPIPWQYGRLLVILALAGGLAAAALLGPDHVLWRLACGAAYLPLLVIGRVIPMDLLRTAVGRLSRSGSAG